LQHHQWQDTQLLQLQPYSRSSGVESSAGELSEREQSKGVEAAAQELLVTMQAAVDVRCLAINTLQQQCQQQQPQEQQQQQQQQPHVQQQQQQPPQGSSQLSASRSANAAHAALPPAPVLILFSGGVDSTLIAALAHIALPPGVPIDLSNVCFDGGRSADRAAARAAVLELAAYAPERPWRLIEVDSSLQEVDELAQHIRSLLLPAATVMDWNIGSALWLAARAEGQVWVPVRQPGLQQQQQQQQGQQQQEAEQGQQQLEQQQDGVEQLSLQEAAPRSAAQDWQLVRLRSGSSTLYTAAAEAGMQPSQSVAPSQQQFQQQQQKQQLQQEVPGSSMYRSAARVVLLGHGADEQCGGYGRHRTK
jgi:asparagine synthetase B (glutamine-hydrolysing)